MKVRFYRGPMDGKVKHIQLPPGRQDIVLHRLSKAGAYIPDPNFHPNTNIFGPSDMGIHLKVDRYVMTRHTHPDGSVFFEWDRPRGSNL